MGHRENGKKNIEIFQFPRQTKRLMVWAERLGFELWRLRLWFGVEARV